MVPTLVANAAINKTLRCAVVVDATLLPIIGGQTLGEQPPTANQESVNFFLITQSFPGEETPGQFTFGWGIIPGNPIEEYLINAGRDKTAITLDFRAPGVEKLSFGVAAPPTIAEAEAAGGAKGLSEITNIPAAAILDDSFRVGNVIEMISKPTSEEQDLFVLAAIMYDAGGDNAKAYTRPVAADLQLGAVVSTTPYAGYKIFDPNINYRVSGTGISFSTDSTGTVPIGQLVMTMDTEPLYQLIRSEDVNLAYRYV